MPLFPPDAAAVLSWGAGNIAATTTTRFLWPGYESELAQTAAVQLRMVRPGTVRNLRIRHNTPAGNGNAIVYTVRVNGVATAIAVSLASTAVDGSDLVDAVRVAAGDLVDIRVTKALGIGSGTLSASATLAFDS